MSHDQQPSPSPTKRIAKVGGAIAVILGAVAAAIAIYNQVHPKAAKPTPVAISVGVSAPKAQLPSFDASVDTQSSADALIAFAQSHYDSTVHLRVHCSGEPGDACAARLPTAIAGDAAGGTLVAWPAGTACSKVICPGEWWFTIDDPNRLAVERNDPRAGSLLVDGYYGVQDRGHPAGAPVTEVLLTAVSPSQVGR